MGRVVDAHGPRIPLIKAFIFCLVGYGGIKRMFDEGVGAGEILSAQQFAMLVLYSSLTGFGGGSATSSAVNATAKSFPQSTVCFIFPFPPRKSMLASTVTQMLAALMKECN